MEILKKQTNKKPSVPVPLDVPLARTSLKSLKYPHSLGPRCLPREAVILKALKVILLCR